MAVDSIFIQNLLLDNFIFGIFSNQKIYKNLGFTHKS